MVYSAENETMRLMNRKSRGKEWHRWGEKIVVARKEHRCSACDHIIKKGERYAASSSPRYDSIRGPPTGSYSIHICLDCLEGRIRQTADEESARDALLNSDAYRSIRTRAHMDGIHKIKWIMHVKSGLAFAYVDPADAIKHQQPTYARYRPSEQIRAYILRKTNGTMETIDYRTFGTDSTNRMSAWEWAKNQIGFKTKGTTRDTKTGLDEFIYS